MRYGVLELVADEAGLERALAELEGSAWLGSEAKDGRLLVFFPTGYELAPLIEMLRAAIPELEIGSASSLEDRDWHESWKRSLSGFELGTAFWVTPSWIAPPITSRKILKIDPERAFGTGTHETTRLCVEAIERFVSERRAESLLDIGTGTGILAMTAAHLGFDSVTGFEPDPDALECAVRNVERNGLNGSIELRPGGWEEVEDRAQLVVANIHLAILEPALDSLQRACIPGGRLILSGLLDEQLPSFENRLADFPRLAKPERAMRGEWATLSIDVSDDTSGAAIGNPLAASDDKDRVGRVKKKRNA